MSGFSVQQQDPFDRDFAPAWRPQPGDTLQGQITYLATRARDEQFGGGRYVILTMRVAEGSEGGHPLPAGEERAIHVLHTVLENELAARRPVVGDELGLLYSGKHERGYHRWKLVCDGDQAAGVDWSEFGDRSHAPPGSRLPGQLQLPGLEDERDDSE